MNYKEFIINNLESEKAGYINLLKTNSLSEDERKVVAEKLDSVDNRLKEANSLDMEEGSKFTNSIKDLNEKFDAMCDKLKETGMNVPKNKVESYLDSKNAIHDFAQSMRDACQQKGSFQHNWGVCLSTNGITIASGSESAYLPAPVKGFIDDAWKQYGEILNDFNITGAKAYYARYTSQSQDSTDVRAKGHNNPSGSSRTKVEQNVTLAGLLIQSDFVYKMIPISNKTIWEDDTMLIQWVMDELLKQWNYEVLRAILIGDGRSSSANDKIYTIAQIARSTGDSFVGVYNSAQSSEATIEYLMDHVISPIDDGDPANDIDLFICKADYTALRKKVNASGATPEYIGVDEVTKMLGVKRVVVVPYLDNTTASGYRAIAVHTKRYAITGSLSPEFVSWENYTTNDTYFRVEIPVGGGVAGLNAAMVAINPAS